MSRAFSERVAQLESDWRCLEEAEGTDSGDYADLVAAVEESDPITAALAEGIEVAAEAQRKLLRRILELTEEVARLREERRTAPIPYRGTWQSAETYRRGDFATYAGGLWHCNRDDPDSKPGDGTGWQLAVKAGRDGRDRSRP